MASDLHCMSGQLQTTISFDLDKIRRQIRQPLERSPQNLFNKSLFFLEFQPSQKILLFELEVKEFVTRWT